MHIQQSTTNLPENLRNGVVAIGNFDGVHRGHRQVLQRALDLARQENTSALVLTFEPHPRTWFRPEVPVFRLTPAALKAELLGAMGFDGVVEQPFDADFSGLTAEEFVKNILVENLAVKHVVVGFDFHFGKGRQGSPEYLCDVAPKSGFETSVIAAYNDHDGQTVSSSAVRLALSDGDLEKANGLLGYPFCVCGPVIKGQQIGRTLGYPTANLELPPQAALSLGIYAVRVVRANGAIFNGVASYGRRPTFDNGQVLLESFLFDFNDDLYGEQIRVELHKKLRDEAKFDSAEALIEQMDKDSRQAKQVLSELDHRDGQNNTT